MESSVRLGKLFACAGLIIAGTLRVASAANVFQADKSSAAVTPITSSSREQRPGQPPPDTDKKAPAQEPDIAVLEIAFAASISSTMPVGQAVSFDAAAGDVFFWNRLKVNHVPAKIRHIWRLNNDKVAEYKLTLHHSETRAWTHQKVKPGQWRVDITDEDRNVIMTATFPVH